MSVSLNNNDTVVLKARVIFCIWKYVETKIITLNIPKLKANPFGNSMPRRGALHKAQSIVFHQFSSLRCFNDNDKYPTDLNARPSGPISGTG